MKKNTFLGLIYLFTIVCSAQTVTTISAGLPDDDMVFDSQGNLYATSYSQGIIYKYDTSWNVSEFSTFPNNPVGIAINSSDEIYNCDFGTSRIRSFLSNGTLNHNILEVGYPAGIIKDFNSDDMIFSKYSGNNIHRLKPDGTISLISNAAGINNPVGLTFGENGELYVANYTSREIHRVLSNGNLEYIATVGNDSNLGYIAYANGFLWGTVLEEHKIYKINPNNTNDVSVFAGSDEGSDDGDISSATFSSPNGILFSDDGDTMYITDFGTKNIRIISGVRLSIEKHEEVNLNLISNLEEHKIILKGNLYDTNEMKLKITNINGETIYNKSFKVVSPNIEKSIKTNAWQTGIYFMTIDTGRKIINKKFVVN